MKNRFVSMLLVICLCIILLPAGASAQDDIASVPKNVGASDVKNRLDYLVYQLDGCYFTTTQQPCCIPAQSGHGCDNCDMANVVKADWLKNAVGLVPNMSSAGKFTHPYYDETLIKGQSCCGFANFAGWYIFAQSENDVVEFELLCSGEYNYTTMSKAKPGDIIRIGSTTSGYGSHSAVVISVDSTNGTYVLDSNWGGDGNCQVDAHYIKFGKYPYVTICRAKNYVESTEQGLDGTYFPDANFRTYIFNTFDKDKSGILTSAECEAVTSIYCSKMGIASLKGVEYFPNLSCLYCGDNSLSALDVSRNTKLVDLQFYSNRLTCIDLSKNTALKTVNCSGNLLTELNVSANTALAELICSNNRLTALDVSRNTKLSVLFCGGNSLAKLDLAANSALSYASVSPQTIELNRELNGLDLSTLVGRSSLSRVTATSGGKLNSDGTVSCAGDTFSYEYDTGSEACSLEVTVKGLLPQPRFSDMVAPSHWAYGSIMYVLDRGIMSGTGNNTFEPNGTVTRAMVAVMLYNLSGEPTVSGDNPFCDASGMWYTDPVIWAYENGIVSGYDDGSFDPNGTITREQLAVMMCNYARYMGKSTSSCCDIDKFADANMVSTWASDSISWACDNGIISGSEETGGLFLNPQGNATRAQIAVIFQNYCEAFNI